MFESSATAPQVPDWLDPGCPPDLSDWEAEWTQADLLRSALTSAPGADLLMDRSLAHVAGLQAKARADVSQRLIAHESARPGGGGSTFATPQMLASAELAAALRMHPRTMDAQLDHAVDLAGPLLPLREVLVKGTVSAAHVSAVSRELHRLPSAADPAARELFSRQCAEILSAVVPYAAEHTPGETRHRTRMLVAAVDPAGARKRRQLAAETEHGVWLTPTEYGQCQLTAVMPLAHGQAVMSAVTALARDPRFETAEGCVTAGQHRVAALVALMLGDPGSVGRVDGPVAECKITAHVSVVVPLSSLVGSDGAAVQGGSVGQEPVHGDVIRELLADAATNSTLRRLVIDGTGCIVDAGRTRYAISEVQRHLIGLRDRTCRFPGCTRRATRCEIDHAVAWDDGGGTDLENLGALCKHHHQLKTHGGWRITRSERSGTCVWRSPLGRIYHHDPPDLLPPMRRP